jgi:tight adherence protein C
MQPSLSIDPLVAFAALAVFFAIALACLALAQVVRRGRLRRRLEKLDESVAASDDGDQAAGLVETIVKATGPLARMVLPESGWEQSGLRQRFVQAGWRSANAPTIFFGLKALLTMILPLLALVLMVLKESSPSVGIMLLVMIASGLFGLYAPNLLLKQACERRQRVIFEGLPDALDLMTICMEAGLSLEGALARVSEEMVSTRPMIAEELQLVVLEMRAGRGREIALRNLAKRNGVEELDALVAALVQAEQFGVSVADSLRTHSDALRSKRKNQAEEQAATVGTRLTFPLMVCILPTLLIVVVGPAILKLIDTFKAL